MMTVMIAVYQQGDESEAKDKTRREKQKDDKIGNRSEKNSPNK